MNVALLTDSDVFAGTERHMLDLAAELRMIGVAPTLVCPSAGSLAQRGRAEGLPVLGMEKLTAIDPGIVRELGRKWKRAEFDVMHAHNGRMALHAALAKATTRRGSLVVTQHFLSPARAGREGLAKLAGQAIHRGTEKFIRRHVAISSAVADAMLARREAVPAKLRVVPNGIRDPRQLPLVPRSEVRTRLNVPDSTPLIVCLARLEPEKGLDILINAMSIMSRDLPTAVCLVAGRGSMEESLRKQITAFQSQAAVRLLGFVEDTLSLLAAADLCVLPSIAEPFGLSLVEAMALGVPVVSTKAGGPLEIVQEDRVGYLVPPGEAEPLANAMRSVLMDERRRIKMGQAAREDFLVRFTAHRMASEMLTVYQEASSRE